MSASVSMIAGRSLARLESSSKEGLGFRVRGQRRAHVQMLKFRATCLDRVLINSVGDVARWLSVWSCLYSELPPESSGSVSHLRAR